MASQSLKAEKPKLPDLYRQLLESKDYALNVEVTIRSDCDNSEARCVAHLAKGTIQIFFWDSEENELGPIDIGYIEGWRTLSFSIDEVIYWSESTSQDICEAFDWLLIQQTEIDRDDTLFNPVLFLDRVEIEPMWRGQGLTLPAVATYLDLLACSFVFLKPAPPGGSQLSPRQHKRMRRCLKQYWQKLGFKHYDKRHNMMWTEAWSCPEWLRAEA